MTWWQLAEPNIVTALRTAVPCIGVSLGRRLVKDPIVKPIPDETPSTTCSVTDSHRFI